MQIYNLGWVALPIGIFFTFKKYYLHSGELWLLLYANLLLLSTLFNGWIMQIIHLIIITSMSTHVLLISKQTNGSMSEKKYNQMVRIFLHLQGEFSIFVYIIATWLFLRVYTDKTYSFGIGTQLENEKIFNGVNSTLSGWNCTQLEFVIIPFIWLIINFISFILGNLIIRAEKDKDHLYKEYVLNYMVLPYIIFSLIIFIYNFYSYKNANNLFECCNFWQYGYPMKIAAYCGFSLSTLYFFYAKKGVFLIEGEQNSSDEQENQKNKNQRKP